MTVLHDTKIFSSCRYHRSLNYYFVCFKRSVGLRVRLVELHTIGNFVVNFGMAKRKIKDENGLFRNSRELRTFVKIKNRNRIHE